MIKEYIGAFQLFKEDIFLALFQTFDMLGP